MNRHETEFIIGLAYISLDKFQSILEVGSSYAT